MKHINRFIKLSKLRPKIALNALKGFVFAKIFKKRTLRGLDIALTYRCNSGCEKCFAKDLIEPNRTEISRTEIVSLINQAIEIGASHVNFTGGEAILRDDIIEIIDVVSKKPIITSIGTCGDTMTDELLEKLKKAGLGLIQISLASHIESEHDNEAGKKGNFKNVMRVIKKAKELNIEILIPTVVTHEKINSDRIEKLVEIAKANNSLLCLILPAEIGGWHNKPKALNREDYNLVTKWLKSPYVTMDIETCYGRGLCPAGTEKVYVSAYGDLFPCPFIHKKYGNVLVQGFTQLWEKMSKDMKAHCGCQKIKG